MSADPLSAWWVHPVTVERFRGDGAYGPVYAPVEALTGFMDDQTTTTVDSTGSDVVAASTLRLPHGTADIGEGSVVRYRGRRMKVVAVTRHDAGPQPVPAHLEVSLR